MTQHIATRLARLELRDAEARQRATGGCRACGGFGRWIVIDAHAPEPPEPLRASGGCPACGFGGVLRRPDRPERYIARTATASEDRP